MKTVNVKNLLNRRVRMLLLTGHILVYLDLCDGANNTLVASASASCFSPRIQKAHYLTVHTHPVTWISLDKNVYIQDYSLLSRAYVVADRAYNKPHMPLSQRTFSNNERGIQDWSMLYTVKATDYPI